MGVKKLLLICIIFCLFATTACSKLLKNPFSGDDDGRADVIPDRILEPTSRFSLALGGVASGRDELVIYDQTRNPTDFSGRTLTCTADSPIVAVKPRPDFDTEAAGSGVQLVPVKAGVTAIRCKTDLEELEDVYEVTIPPQSLIQILVAEAASQLADEAVLDNVMGIDFVATSSQSATGDLLGTVIRNRISKINNENDVNLFEADEDRYDSDPPVSYYDAVIMADDQFSPTDSKDPSYEMFTNAANRKLLSGRNLIAYDQAVLTAASVFNGDVTDGTGGSFAFRSPNTEEWAIIETAKKGKDYYIPDGAGSSDTNFPNFAPIQLLVHPDVWKYSDGRPSFVLVRQRTELDLAVTDAP